MSATPTTTPTLDNMPAWMKDVSYTNDADTHFLRALLYGEMGSGKTSLMLTFPSPFIIDVDHGLLTGKDFPFPSVKVYPPKDRRDKDNVVYQKVMDILTDARHRTGPFAPDGPLADIKTIGLDGYTALAHALMKELLIKDGLDPISNRPEFEHWRYLLVKLQNITDLIEQVPFHVVATCGSKEEKDETTGAWMGKPEILGSYRDNIGYRFDEVYYLEPRRSKASDGKDAKGLIYEMHTARYKIYGAKSRFGLPSTIQDPTFQKIQQLAGVEAS